MLFYFLRYKPDHSFELAIESPDHADLLQAESLTGTLLAV